MPASRTVHLDWVDDEQDEDDIPDDDDDNLADFFPSSSQHERTPSDHPGVRRTRKFKTNQADLQERLLRIFEFMQDLQVDLPILLEALSFAPEYPEIRADLKLSFEITALMVSRELPTILQRWYKPPREHNKGKETHGASKVLGHFAQETTLKLISNEMKSVMEYMRSPPSELSEEMLLSFNWKNTISDTKELAPTTFSLLRRAAYTKKQEKRNTVKDPDAAVTTMIAMSAFMRSNRCCRLHKTLTMYFKSCGLSNKAFDTLHALGISMNQKWAYTGIDAISAMAQQALREDIRLFQHLGMHDNLNLAYHTYEQRLSNAGHFDSGTAGTVIIVKDPDAPIPSNAALRAQQILGEQNHITFRDILRLDSGYGPSIEARKIWLVLKVLLDSPPFDYDTYEHQDHALFTPPPPIHQLPTGQQHATCQYMLPTVHIEEASYEGNERLIKFYEKELGWDSKEAQQKICERVIPWCGDQLTVSRLRGLSKHHWEDLNGYERMEHLVFIFGWLHALMAMEQSIHSQYYGTRAGLGLLHAFELLKCKGLHAPSVKGNFHYGIQEAFHHIAEARFRDLWCELGGVEKLEDLRTLSPDELCTIATRIIREFGSADALRKLRRTDPDEQDELLIQAVQFNRDISDYILLTQAVGSGDVGLIEQLLPRLLFRYAGGGNSKYAHEILELLQGFLREWPEDLKLFIVRYCWLANTTGRAEGFEGLDQLQEHNVRDSKTIFGMYGPFATWDYIQKISASIPCQRKVKDHIEAEINHFRRGKSHTSPDKEEDVSRLQASFHASKLHKHTPGRSLNARDKVPDNVEKGSGIKLKNTITAWWNKRYQGRATVEDWESDSDSDS